RYQRQDNIQPATRDRMGHSQDKFSAAGATANHGDTGCLFARAAGKLVEETAPAREKRRHRFYRDGVLGSTRHLVPHRNATDVDGEPVIAERAAVGELYLLAIRIDMRCCLLDKTCAGPLA